MPDGSLNPLPLIQIPYARLREKHGLTSVVHEVGHYAFNRIGLHEPPAHAAFAGLRAAGSAPEVSALYSSWMREIGPDFWTFGNAGAAHASALRELLSLPARIVMKIDVRDPHPPPFLRVLLGFAWCRRAWGAGAWDTWEAEWLRTFGDGGTEMAAARAAIPAVTAMLFTTRFAALDGRTLPDLFDLANLGPDDLLGRMRGLSQDLHEFLLLRPCVQLCVFRLTHEGGRATQETIDHSMNSLAQLDSRWRAATKEIEMPDNSEDRKRVVDAFVVAYRISDAPDAPYPFSPFVAAFNPAADHLLWGCGQNNAAPEVREMFDAYFRFGSIQIDTSPVSPLTSPLPKTTCGPAGSDWPIPATCVRLDGKRPLGEVPPRPELFHLFVGDAVWLYYHDEMGILRIVQAMLDDFEFEGGSTRSSARSCTRS